MFQPKEGNPNVMLALSFCRIVFIPLFLLCNVQPRHHIPVLFDSDIAPMLIMIVFAFTNGYFGTLCMIYGPRYVWVESKCCLLMRHKFVNIKHLQKQRKNTINRK